MDRLLELALDAAQRAGASVMRYYQQSLAVIDKQDGSPLTLADQDSHLVILECLSRSGLAMVSEEGGEIEVSTNRYWLVDPLDGTKDFLAGNGEFTINIGLIDNGRPALGVIFAPAIGELYWGSERMGAWRISGGFKTKLLPQVRTSTCRMAVSRFHDHPDVDIFATQNRIVERLAVGSALKYGLLATGDVDVFPRLVGSSEWDTAAGQAVLEAAGGAVLDWHTGKSLRYGKARRRNPRLFALRAPYRREEFILKEYKKELL